MLIIGPLELVIPLLLLIILFGGGRLRRFARWLGTTLRTLRQAWAGRSDWQG